MSSSQAVRPRKTTGSKTVPPPSSPRHRRSSRPPRSRVVTSGAGSSSLPPSSSGSPRTQVAGVQRVRILSAAARVVGELGYEGMSVARITAGAGISRRTFYDLYEHREDCFLDLFEEVVTRAHRVARDAAAGHESWRERVRAGLLALLVLIDEEPALGSLLVVDALGAGPRVLERRARELQRLSEIVDQGRGEARNTKGKASSSSASTSASSLTAEGVVGAVLSVIHARLSAQGKSVASANGSRGRGPSRPLIALLNPLMGVIVLPYLGQDAAAEELTRPVPRKTRKRSKSSRAQHTSRSEHLLEGLDMRLTYRTLRVISGVATQPGASNRQVADAAGIHDQGQISKLLGRLERLGLVENSGEGQTKGEPNAWTLTTRGTQIQRTIETQTTATVAPPA
jgi:AcrR family transcriptional regulator/predicted transcriptional regulator